MASKLVILAVTVLIYKVQSQAVVCYPNSQPLSSSNIQIIPSNSNGGITASPQLQILPGQGNLKAIPIANLVARPQGSNLQRPPAGCNAPRPNIRIPIPQIPSPAQCPPVQPPCDPNPIVISAPVSTIAIPPSCSTTLIDTTLCNSLASALQLLIANDFLNCAVSKNIVNQDCVALPAVGSCIPSYDISSLVRCLNANQGQDACQSGLTNCGQTCQSGSSCNSQTCQPNPCSFQPDESLSSCDWESLLTCLRADKCSDPDWAIVLDYINYQIDRSDRDRSYDRSCSVETEPDCNYDYGSVRQRGQSGPISGQRQPQCDRVPYQQPAYPSSQSCDADSAILEAIIAYLESSDCGSNSYPNSYPSSYSGSDITSNCYPTAECYPTTNTVPSIAEVLFPEEIPAQLICNFGYLPTSVPVVTFSVQPDPSCNIGVGSKCQS